MNNIHHSLQSLAINIDKLSFLEGNPRQGDVEAVAKSYKQFGQRKPIVATTNHVVIAGNHQLAAARQLGWDEIAVVITDDDELTAKAFALADNRTAELGSYDDDLLADLLSEVSSVPELMDSTGFSEDDLFDLIGFDDDLEDEEEIELPVEPKTKLGDMYKLGNHYLLCGDATKEEDVKKLLQDNTINLVFTDPPYNALESWNKKWGKSESRLDPSKWFENDNFESWDEYYDFLIKSFNNVKAKSWYICCDYRIYAKIFHTIPEKLRHLIVWKKNVWGLGKRYRFQHEFIIYAATDDSIFYGDRSQSDVWEFDVDRSVKHNTPKPIPLVQKAILNSSSAKDNVYDMFGGSGTTLLAAEKTHRNCFMMELSPLYCDLIIERWENLTGQKAELVNG
jgi:site-specific DNA-methyltransferase (adenine-specific)|tara:strand:- start:1515 stop:2696 length:1182 start_codon:yes stop_codon:yes gene_type:complete